MSIRTITLNLSEEFLDATIDNKTEANNAIGYLSTWAITSERYCALYLYGEDNGNISALYKDKDLKPTYEMLAQRREDGSYSFHS